MLESETENTCLRQHAAQLEKKLVQEKSPVAEMKDDDNQIHFYTGLPSYAVFIFSLLDMISAQSTGSGLSAGDKCYFS